MKKSTKAQQLIGWRLKSAFNAASPSLTWLQLDCREMDAKILIFLLHIERALRSDKWNPSYLLIWQTTNAMNSLRHATTNIHPWHAQSSTGYLEPDMWQYGGIFGLIFYWTRHIAAPGVTLYLSVLFVYGFCFAAAILLMVKWNKWYTPKMFHHASVIVCKIVFSGRRFCHCVEVKMVWSMGVQTCSHPPTWRKL